MGLGGELPSGQGASTTSIVSLSSLPVAAMSVTDSRCRLRLDTGVAPDEALLDIELRLDTRLGRDLVSTAMPSLADVLLFSKFVVEARGGLKKSSRLDVGVVACFVEGALRLVRLANVDVAQVFRFSGLGGSGSGVPGGGSGCPLPMGRPW